MRGELQPETASYLPIIRGWLPASAARAAIDDIGKLALRQGLADVSKQNRAEPIVSDILATTADGVGAQGLTIVGKLQAQTFVAMILLKTGYGIKAVSVTANDGNGRLFSKNDTELAWRFRVDPDFARYTTSAQFADGNPAYQDQVFIATPPAQIVELVE